jgi:DNA primase
MAGHIPTEFIDEVLAHTDIVDVIDARVPLKRSGSNHMACCPFHGEKTPSFSVSQTKQFYYCFGCGAKGNAISFLMDYEHQGFVEAVEELAQCVGLEVPTTAYQGEQQKQLPGQYELMEQVAKYYQYQLTHHQQAEKVNRYIRQRGLSQEVVERFSLGYSPPGRDNVLNVMGAGKLEKINALFETGMLIKKDDGSGYYDRFRDRLMFPILDRRGRTIGFGGRILGDGKPKYLNSPETSLFHKGQELYGLYELKQSLRKIDQVVVVEGYMDVVSLAQFDVNYAVATLGTATTSMHLEKLFRLSDEVIFCFDGDRAGKAAAWRAMKNALEAMKAGKQARFMFLPDGEDPDTLIRSKGKKVFEQMMGEALEFSTFFFQTLTQQVNMNSLDGRSKLIDQCKPYIEKIRTGAFQTLMISRLSELAEIDRNTLLPLLGMKISQAGVADKASVIRGQMGAARKKAWLKPQGPTPVRKAIAYLLQYPELAEMAGDPGRFSRLTVTDINLFIRLLDLLQNDPHLTIARLLANWTDSGEHQYLADLVVEPLLFNDEAVIVSEFHDILQLLSRQYQQQRFEQLQRQERGRGLDDIEKREYLQLLKILKRKQ